MSAERSSPGRQIPWSETLGPANSLISAHRGLVRGAVHDAEGHLVTTAMQGYFVRRAPRSTTTRRP